MKPFKNGAFRLAAEVGVPIVPVTWQSNYRIMRDPEKPFEYSAPHAVRVVIHEPVSAAGQSEEDVVHLRNEVFRVIDSALPEAFRKHHDH
jgi:1-acyl-sn-glycerol-3-phosphate acyltransferase